MVRVVSKVIPLVVLLLSSHALQAAEAVSVDVIKAKAQSSQQVLTLTGSVEAKQNAQLAPLQSGVVQEIFVEEGDKVSKGQKLMVLDTRLAELNLAQSKAAVAASQAAKSEAERLYKEVISLSEKQLVAETLLAERKSGVEVAVAELRQATSQLAYQKEIVARHTLYAPFEGLIAQRHIDLGEWLSSQSVVFTLVEQQKLRVKLAIPQEYYGQLGRGDAIEAVVTPDFASGQSITAQLNRVVNVASDISRTITGFVDIPANNYLVAGMSAQVELMLPASEQSLIWLPKSAVKQHPDGGFSVFTSANNKAKRILVTIAKYQGDKVAVLGAPENASYIVSGVELLKDGDPLKINQLSGDAL